jgi:two-component system sensor histidine kinase CpxA
VKPSKLYIKIFISFLLILIVAELLIFGLFGIIVGRHIRSEFDRYASAQVMLVKEIVEGKVRAAPGVELSQNESLKGFIRDWGELLGAEVWLQDSGGEVLAKSFREGMPKELDQLKAGRGRDLGHFKLYHGRRGSRGVYAIVPMAFEGGKSAELHVFFARTESSHPEGGFALGLGMIGVVIALLVIPVSRFISKPINELRRSARRIAEGDLSHRARVKRKDEIGHLGSAFNHMADRLEKMIRGGRELTAHISHELRTPLARIRIAEEMLREKLEKGNHKDLDRHLDDIREDIEELDDLIGRILMLSKLDLKERSLSLEDFNPVDLMNGLLSRLKPSMDQKGLHLTTDISFEPPFSADPEALQTAFSNILDNAVKYSPPGGRLDVEMKSGEKALEFSVTNTADRIPEKDLDLIFEPFQRLGKRGEKGSGLGLAIVKKIVEAHGGTIQARNRERGFAIEMKLPRNPMEDHPPPLKG